MIKLVLRATGPAVGKTYLLRKIHAFLANHPNFEVRATEEDHDAHTLTFAIVPQPQRNR